MSPEEQRSRGINAKRLIEDPMFAEAFANVEKSILNGFRADNLLDADLTRLWISLKMLAKVKAQLEAAISAGAMAEFQLKEKKSL